MARSMRDAWITILTTCCENGIVEVALHWGAWLWWTLDQLVATCESGAPSLSVRRENDWYWVL